MALPTWKNLLLRLARLAVIALGAAGLFFGKNRPRSGEMVRPSLEQVRHIFPSAASVAKADRRGFFDVRDAKGDGLGKVGHTLPQKDEPLGYCGPSQVLFGLDPRGIVHGWRLLHSPDTPEHLDMIRGDAAFGRTLVGWDPQTTAPAIDAVSGATLTSLAMMQGITQKLQGQAGVSALFPGGADPARQRELFPTGSLLTPMPPKEMVRDATGQLLGFALHSAPHADAVRGYQGPTEVLVALDVDGNTVRQVALGRSYDNEPYVGYVREDRSYLKSFAGRSLASLADMDYAKEGIEGVSGATLTSFAVAESLKRTAQAAARPPGSLQGSWAPRREDWAILAVTVGGLLMAFSPLRGKKWARVAWQVILIAFLGLGLGALLSMHLLGGWAQHGVNWRGALGLVLLATVALLTPLATGRQVYCHQLCPHGALQLWMGRLTKRKWSPSPAWQTWLRWIGPSTLLLGLISLALSWNWPLASFEPFDAWVVLAANWVSIGLAVLGLVASIFIPQAYCHYGCPTGSLLSYLRTTGQSSWQVRDWLALLGMSLIWILTIFTN